MLCSGTVCDREVHFCGYCRNARNQFVELYCIVPLVPMPTAGVACWHFHAQDGCTPLHVACEQGSNAVVWALVNAGADVKLLTRV